MIITVFSILLQNTRASKGGKHSASNEPNISVRSAIWSMSSVSVSLSRSNRGVTLTPEGQKLYTRVAAAHHQLSSAEAELADAKSFT